MKKKKAHVTVPQLYLANTRCQKEKYKKKSSRANKREISQRRLRITWKKTTKTAAYIKRLWRVDVEDMCSLGRIEILIVGAIEFRRNDNRRG